MTISEKDEAALRALAAARQKHENLSGLLDFYYDLYQVQFESKEILPSPQLRDEMAMRWRLQGGIPQLTFEQLQIKPDAFAELVGQVALVLHKHQAAPDLDEEAHEAHDLVALARSIFETWDTLTGPAAEEESAVEPEAAMQPPVKTAVALALAAYLQRAKDRILPEIDLSMWVQSYCPVCGGQPNLAMLEGERGARRLICSRCDAQWPYSRVGCPFCRSKEKQTYYASEDQVYRLYVCPDCRRYLKTVDLREVHGERFPVVERLLTVNMDLAAQQEGFGS
jgi:formate dehydrogenase accessory protein FdhE